ncbi:MAG TPA: hypothetical protein VMW85_07105 [Methanomassiliicoccales archaeon]|nr:hypothetical protein [Methanomassiliicoccales archaeon]
MAEESNVHIKLAGAEVLGLFLVSIMAILVGMFGLGVFDDLSVIAGVAALVGTGLFLCTIVAYLNENILVSAAFGLFAVFLLGFAAMATPVLTGAFEAYIAAEIYTIFVGLGLLMVGIVAFAQPVKILPIFLVVAALAFVCLGLWFDMGEDIRMVVGLLWTIASLMALYMATAIAFLVVKGKVVLPLLIKA